MSELKQFKAESQRLLDLMINSIYTHKEIFLRELISNSSDAIDKHYFVSLRDNTILDRDQLAITVQPNKEQRTITITDTGIGMTAQELEEILGTIAQSGSLAFKKQLETAEQKTDEIDIIGQFGVGFYSAFMVAKQVTVITKPYQSDIAYRWQSNAADGYTISEDTRDTVGTTIILELKENTEDENYDTYLDEYKLKSLIKKYSDYVHYPIRMEVEKKEYDEEGNVKETTKELETLNSMIPLWKKNKNDISEEDYNNFYMDKFNDYENTQKVIHMNAEGTVSFTSLLFIPGRAPYNFYNQDYEKGLQLYSRGVFIMDKANDLIPEHFRFVRGLVDSQDLSLNISREMLQHDRQLKQIASRIEKKIKSELELMLKNDREAYEVFWKNFGLNIKYGVYNEFGMHKELLKDLLLFYSSSEQKLVTLDEYVARMKEEQKYIYYASGESYDKIDKLPQTELVKEKGYEILYLTDNIDEFTIQVLMNYNEKQFKSINQGDLELESDEEKKQTAEKTSENKDLLGAIKDALAEKVSDVRISSRLKSHPVCLVSDEGLSFEMEKVLAAMPDAQGKNMKAKRILEINPNHAIFQALQKVATSKEKIHDYADLLFNQAMLIEGFTIEDPIAFSNRICDLIVEANTL